MGNRTDGIGNRVAGAGSRIAGMGGRIAGAGAAPVTRRTLLRGTLGVFGAGVAATVGLSGCTGDRTPQPLPDQLDDFIAATAALAGRYEAAIGAAPGMTVVLTAIRNAHHEHLTALIDATAGHSIAPGSPATAQAAAQQAVAELVAAERAGRDDAVKACLSASNRLAPLLGAIAAARAAHVEVLS